MAINLEKRLWQAGIRYYMNWVGSLLRYTLEKIRHDLREKIDLLVKVDNKLEEMKGGLFEYE
jgi:hypothetical protein